VVPASTETGYYAAAAASLGRSSHVKHRKLWENP